MAQIQRIRRKKKQNVQERFFDYTLLFVVLFLVVFGLLMIYSTSSYEAKIEYGNAAFYLKKQILSSVLGLVAMALVSKMPYQFLKKFDMIAIGVAAFLILLVLTPLGVTRNGATRWIDLKIGLTVQPAEIAKICVIIYSASKITKLGKKVSDPIGLMTVIGPPMVIAGMIYVLTDNMSSAIIVAGIALLMVFVATPNYKEYIILAVVGIALAGAIVLFAVNSDGTAGLGFRLVRIRAWLDPESYSTDRAFQSLQALYAIGSGGIWGKGLGQSMQKLGFIPEAQNDMIFSIICEELGLFGAIAVIMLFVILIWRCMVIANNAEDLFGALIVVGVMAHFAIQVVLNIAVVTNTIPNTGITLPFISYGGSSALFLLTEVGLVFSVGNGIRLKNI